MSYALDSWRLHGETSTWIFAIICTLIALYLGIRAWLRMKKNRKIAFWEAYRFLIIILIILTLFNPERIEKFDQVKVRKRYGAKLPQNYIVPLSKMEKL